MKYLSWLFMLFLMMSVLLSSCSKHPTDISVEINTSIDTEEKLTNITLTDSVLADSVLVDSIDVAYDEQLPKLNALL